MLSNGFDILGNITTYPYIMITYVKVSKMFCF